MSFNLNFLKGINNDHIELGRLVWALTCFSFIIFQGLAIWANHQPFSPTDFGVGAAGILAAGGAGVALKETAVAKARAVGEGASAAIGEGAP